MKLASLILASVLSVAAMAADTSPRPIRDRIHGFLDKNVIGRTQKVVTEGTISDEGNQYLVKFEAKISYAGLQKTEEGLTFDETREIKQTNTKLDKNGKSTAEVISTDRTVVHHYAVAERETTQSLVGLITMTKNTLEDPTGKGAIAMMEISADGKELYLYQSMAGFVEASIGNSFGPVASAADATFFLDASGKLVTQETLKFYKVNVAKDYAREEISRFNVAATQVTP